MADQQMSRGGNCESLSFTGTSQMSAKVYSGIVALTPTQDCYVRQGPAPVALATGVDQFLAAGTVQEYGIQNNRIAVIAASASGVLHITSTG